MSTLSPWRLSAIWMADPLIGKGGLAASDGFPHCWGKASCPFTRCNVHAFILHPEFSSRAPLEISLYFDDPNLPHENGGGGWAHSAWSQDSRTQTCLWGPRLC